MIIFAIPFRARETMKNQEACERRLSNTLASVFNQTNPNFKCILVCNQMPESVNRGGQYDDRLEVITSDLAIPSWWIEMARDKYWKLTIAAVRIREILLEQPDPSKGIYVMPVDADDLLNRNLAQWCEEHPDANGAVSADGYVWEEGSRIMRTYPELHTFCGSCNIIKMYAEDLPERMPYPDDRSLDMETARELNARYPIRFDHNLVVEKYAGMGKPFETLPFRSTIYLRETGENISGISHAEKIAGKEIKERFHPVAFLRRCNVLKMRRISKKIKREFGITA